MSGGRSQTFAGSRASAKTRATLIAAFVATIAFAPSPGVRADAAESSPKASRAGSPDGATAAARLQVVEREWRIQLSRARVRPGRVTIEVVNMGEDDHDLRTARSGGSTYTTPTIPAGDRVARTVRLRAGRYRLWCSLPGHRARGMSARLTVSRNGG